MELSLPTLIGSALMIGTRIAGLMLFAPFFSHTAIPGRIKALLVLLITVLLYPTASRFQLQITSIWQWPMIVMSELIVGVGVGIATNLVFEAAQFAGSLTSIQVGYSLVNILDPQTQVESTVVAVFHQTIAMLIFLQMDVHHWILRGIASSFQYLPAGEATANFAFTSALTHSVSSVLVSGVQIAAPTLASTLLADVTLGFLGKASSQMQVMLMGVSVKTILGLIVLIAALRYWPALFERYFGSSMRFCEQLLHLAKS